MFSSLSTKALPYIYIALLLVVISMFSCNRNTRRDYKNNSSNALSLEGKIENIDAFKSIAINNNLEGTSIRTLGLLSINNQSKLNKVNVDITNILGKQISVSAGIFGFVEVAKVYIDKDSVKLNIISQEPQEYNYNYFNQYVPIKFELKDLQNLFLGLNLWEYANNSIAYVDNVYTLKNEPDAALEIVARYNKYAKPMSISISTKNKVQSYLKINYSNFTSDNLAKNVFIDTKNGEYIMSLDFVFSNIGITKLADKK
ncbi:MAG: DUF4292 domain-containing protein [Solitalea-like symbiont of Tyrophagus putrescentiae]